MPAPSGAQFGERLQNNIQRGGAPEAAGPGLTKFNLDFPGGTPAELVAAIKKATGQPLNVIIPTEFSDVVLPALKMTSVNVVELFQALQAASRKSEVYPTSSYYGGGAYGGYSSYQTRIISYGFKTEGTPSDASIWYFYVDRPLSAEPAPSPKVCRFYSLAPYIERGVSVDDITTAIETGWKMLGETNPPTISFHKDTKLLIAVGEPSKLETIDAVLKALEPPKPPSAAPAATAKPAEKAKAGK